ncbi:MAG: hypothetical protein QM756_03555 [Polyangiaceae bacterium]
MALGGVFAAQAYGKNQDSLKECRKGEPNACTAEGVALRDDARTAGTRATIGFIAGGVLLGTSVTLLVLAPSRHAETTSALQPRLRSVALTGGGVSLAGVF